MPNLYPGAALVGTGLAVHGYRKGSLSASGAVAAFLVGYGHLANPLKVFGVTMIVFYLVASRATKVGYMECADQVQVDTKARLEDGIDPSRPGNRDAIQVLCNSLPSLIAAVAYRVTDLPKKKLLFAALGHFANCLADTLASELGILSKSPPRYILTGEVVPPGTNGGVSLLGLGASLAGGVIIGMTMTLDLAVESGYRGYDLVYFGAIAGLGGSLLDSLLGATLQETRYDGRITLSKRGRRIGWGRNVLSNSGVNFVCGFAMAALGYAC